MKKEFFKVNNLFFRNNVLSIIFCLFLSTSSCAFAGTTYTSPIGNFDSGVIDQSNLMQIKEYEAKAREQRRDEHKGNEEIQMNKELKDQVDKLPNKEVSFKLNSIKFQGYTAYTEEELMNLVCDKVGTEVTVGDLVGLTNMVTDFYQQHGYISSVAYLPPQKVQDGNIQIVIMEGKYGSINVANNKWEKTNYIKNAYLADRYIEQGKLLNVKDIQESLREINASGYMKGSIALSDNEESAEFTDLELSIKDRFPIDFDFRWDDMGTASTGLNRAVFFAGTYNLTGHGDSLYSTTTLARRSIGQGIFYSIPIAKTKETKLTMGYSYSGATVGGAMDDLNIDSKSHNFFASVSRRLIKTENYKLYGDIGLDIRNTKSTWDPFHLFGRQDLYAYNSRNLKVNLTNIRDDFYGKTFVNVGTGIGLPMMDETDRFYEYVSKSDKRNPSNNAVRVMANIARLQVLPWRSTAVLQASGQWADRALLPSEKMSIGGMSTVRGYEESFYMKDYGATASVEVRTPVPFLRMALPEKLHFIDDSIRLAAFYDMGWFGNVKQDNDGPSVIMGTGGGLVLKLTRYLSGNLYVGIPVGNKPENGSSCRVHFILSSNIL